LLLVLAATFLVIVLFQPLLKKYLPQPPAAPAQSQTQALPQSAPAPAAGVVAQGNQLKLRKPVPAVGTIVASTESETVIENDLYRIVFTNRGAQVKSWVLKRFDDERGQPLDLVNRAAAEKYGCPLSLWTYDET